MRTLKIELPKGMMNINVSICNHLIGDTNNSVSWDTFKIPLPKGEWNIKSPITTSKDITLIDKSDIIQRFLNI
jgi:lysophospholipid acyltransferase (LPLAT)-like uncharacterized protein